jgi:ribosomal protein S18 acetylase RimI-like enzyme
MTPVIVRPAEHADLAAVRDFGRRVVVPFYQSLINLDFGEAIWRQHWGSDLQEGAIAEHRVLLVEANGRIVGVTEFGEYEGEPVMWKLYVSPHERGLGIGRKLAQGVCDAVAGQGASSLLVEHPSENEGAGRFYDSLGFVVAWVDKGEGPGGTTVWRRKKL